jgi:hypothetical protein
VIVTLPRVARVAKPRPVILPVRSDSEPVSVSEVGSFDRMLVSSTAFAPGMRC